MPCQQRHAQEIVSSPYNQGILSKHVAKLTSNSDTLMISLISYYPPIYYISCRSQACQGSTIG